jgi:hypothetical protein
MKALSESYNIDYSQLLMIKPTLNSKNCYNNSYIFLNSINNNMYMNYQLNYKDLKNCVNLISSPKSFNFINNKEHQELINNNDVQNSGKNEQVLQNKTNLDFISEFTKFKTELCHSWELTGTCKYGVNVIKYIF